jgi:hypothetical protein
MLLYWGQSVVIGIANVFRMLALEHFSTENFKINDRAVEPTPAVKMQVALFFAVHYGFFHLVYFVFIVAAGRGGRGDALRGACAAPESSQRAGISGSSPIRGICGSGGAPEESARVRAERERSACRTFGTPGVRESRQRARDGR